MILGIKYPCRHNGRWCTCWNRKGHKYVMCRARGVKIRDRISQNTNLNQLDMHKNHLGYRANRQEKVTPKLFGPNNRPLDPQTKAGASYIVNPAGSGNNKIKSISMYPSTTDMIMNPNR